jgi:tetratricopeptide (TPR) repeat protein
MKYNIPLRAENPMGVKILRSCAIALLMLCGCSGVFFSSISNLFGNPQAQLGAAERAMIIDSDPDETRQALSIAEAQHEKIRVLISQGRYDRVPGEVKTILDLKLPDKYESNVAKSACIIANDLAEKLQFSLAHEVLDEALRHMKLNENKASVLKIQAFVYKTEGNLDKALQCLERAIELEKQGNRP